MKKYISLALSAAVIASATAQDLRTEITVDRTVQPDLREATRLGGIVPTIATPSFNVQRIEAAEYTDAGTITNEVSPLPAATWADSVAHTPYRGYAMAGYLPIYNLGVCAGYRLIDNNDLQLGIWGEYNGNSYNGDIPHFDDALFTNHVGIGGINGSYRTSPTSILKFNIDGMGALVRTPYYFLTKEDYYSRRSYNQKSYIFSPSLQWQGIFSNLLIKINGGWERFKFFNDMPLALTGYIYAPHVHQNAFDAAVGVGLCDDNSTTPWVGVDFDATVLHTNRLLDSRGLYISGRMSEGHIRPYLAFDGENLNGHVGLNLSVAASLGGRHVKIAPDVLVAWNASQSVVIYGQLKGGEYINRMSDLYMLNPYMNPLQAYERTNMPIIAEAGLNFGPLNGLTLGVKGGYAKANDYLSPMIQINTDGYMSSYFEKISFGSWFVGANAGYAYENLLSVDLTAKYGGASKDTRSWYGWIDGAQFVFDLQAKATPIDQLDVTLGFELRTDRKAASIVYPYDDPYAQYVMLGRPNLGDIHNLKLGGLYRIDNQLSVFARLDNLLFNHYRLISGNPAQGIGGLIGATYKF